jgi:NAD(P)-dependent dehydrogenase (short-subunit alcohol dehydrogenase family)
MTSRTCLITGTTSGIGRATAAGLAARELRVVMACRDPARGRMTAAEITAETGNRDIHVLKCDLASLESVRTCASEFKDRFGTLNVLINNAATMITRPAVSTDGFELTMAVNYLAPYLLTREVLPVMETGGRIVNVASNVHRLGRLDHVSAGITERPATGMRAYAASKLALVMFTLSLADRLSPAAVTANCLHPGVVFTNITGATNAFLRFGMKLIGPLLVDPAGGARTSLFAALDPDLAGVTGRYFTGRGTEARPARAALDTERRDRLWALTEALCSGGSWGVWADPEILDARASSCSPPDERAGSSAGSGEVSHER